jgi:tetratricopeptide (TPR) repeat protein
MTPCKSAIHISLLCLLLLLLGAQPLGATVSFKSGSTTSQSTANSTSQFQTDEDAKIRQISDRLRETQHDLQIAEQIVLVVATILTVFFGAVAVIPLVQNMMAQRDVREMNRLFLTGERSRQSQASEMHNALKGSSDTIQLVNDTLRLAKDASERAASSIERRAKAELDALDLLASELLIRPTAGDDRALVSDPKNRAEVESLAERINAFDIYRVLLDDKITLTPSCLFIKATHAHLKQHYEEAIRIWQRAASDANADPTLRSLSWYWKGYESNNLAKFEEARIAFSEAERLADGARRFELKRIGIESEFFDFTHFTTPEVLNKISSLLCEAEEQRIPSEVLNSIRRSKGNILYVYGRELRISSDSTQTAKAPEVFRQARAIFRSVSKPEKWSWLGEAQCSLALREDVAAAIELLRTKVRRDAQKEYVRRVEPRTKALARFTELLCCIADPDANSERDDIYRALIGDIGEVDNRLTIYSLLQRRNVSKEQFQQDVDIAIRESELV